MHMLNFNWSAAGNEVFFAPLLSMPQWHSGFESGFGFAQILRVQGFEFARIQPRSDS